MNEQVLISDILSKPGMKILAGLPTKKKNAVSLEDLAKKVGYPESTAYRIMSKLVEWSNIATIKIYTSRHPLTLYYLKNNSFTVKINKEGIAMKVKK